MLLRPLPDINQAFSLVFQQERQFNAVPNTLESSVFAASSSSSGGRGGYHNNGHFSGRYRGNSSFRGRGVGRFREGGRFGSKRPICVFCRNGGHTVDTCYRKNGFPLDHNNTNNDSSKTANLVEMPLQPSSPVNTHIAGYRHNYHISVAHQPISHFTQSTSPATDPHIYQSS